MLQCLTSVVVAVAPFDVTDHNTQQPSEWWRLFGCKGELCRPPCENGGRCLVNEKGEWRCYCWPDFSGERCEVNHCAEYCLNGGTCIGSPLGKSASDKSRTVWHFQILDFVSRYFLIRLWFLEPQTVTLNIGSFFNEYAEMPALEWVEDVQSC